MQIHNLQDLHYYHHKLEDISRELQSNKQALDNTTNALMDLFLEMMDRNEDVYSVIWDEDKMIEEDY